MISGHLYHDDVQGILQMALTGVTQYTMRQIRSLGIVAPHIVRCVRVAPVGTNWGASNEFALLYKDAHQPVNRFGSYGVYTD